MKKYYEIFSLTSLMVIPISSFAQNKNISPNIIIILADDLGYGDLDWLGAKTISTPNVSHLAENGVRLTNCYTTSATSTPSRYGLLTGIYPWRKEGTGIASGDAAMIIEPEQYTIADLCKAGGYVTGAVGKWHLGLGAEKGTQNWNDLISPNLSDIGFDYSFIMAATGDRVPCVYIENGRVANLNLNDPIEVSYTTPYDGEPTALTHPEMLRILPSQGHDQSIVNGISRIGYMRGGTSARWNDENIADDITSKAIEFIDNNQDKPFFLYFGTHDIHVPRIPHQRFKGISGMGSRGDAILSFDYCVGKISKTLDSLGLTDNTLIIISSDNGPVIDDGYQDQAKELLGSHKPADKLRAGKYSIYDGGTKVPCIISWPVGIKKHSINNSLISQIDFMATIAHIIDRKLPSDKAFDSKNMYEVIVGKSNKHRNHLIQQNVNNTLSIIKNGWKYIEPSQAEPIEFWTKTELGNAPFEQLYHIKKDIVEKNNLATKRKGKKNALKTILNKEKKSIILK